MIPIDYAKLSSQPLKKSTKIFSYENQLIVKVLTSSNQEQLVSNMEEVVKNSNHTHPNVVACVGFNTQFIDNNHTKLYILYPSLKQSLADIAEQHVQNKTQFTSEELLRHFDGLLGAGEYLEEQNITHKNIKPQNIAFDQFGIIKISEMGSGSVEKAKVLNSLYVAPEISQKDSLSEEEWRKADVWSVGMVILEMCDFSATKSSEAVKSFSYSDSVFSEINARIENLKKIHNGGNEFAQILSLMLNPEPSVRPTFKQAKWLFFDKVLSGSTVPGYSDENYQEAGAPSDEEREMGDDADVFEVKEESKEQQDTTFFSQLKDSQQHFYNVFYAKFLDRFQLTINASKTNVFICLKTAQQRQQQNDPNLQEVIPTIRKITVKSMGINDEGACVLAAGLLLFSAASELHIDFRNAKITDKAFFYLTDFCLGHFKNLKMLYIWTDSPQVTDKAVSSLARGPLSKMTGLRNLFLYFPKTQITDQMFFDVKEPIMKMKDLTNLQFWVFNTKVTDNSIRMICSEVLYHKTELQTLSLAVSNTKVTSASVQELTYVVLPRLPKLRNLYLLIANLNLGEDILSNLFKYGLAGLSQLETIRLGLIGLKSLNETLCDQLIEVGLGNKPNIKNLKLYFSSTKVTNKSVVDIFYKLLPRLNRLENVELFVKDSKVDTKVVDQVKHLPFYNKCKITF